eukprot:6690398-Prymnesium_polylepis.2
MADSAIGSGSHLLMLSTNSCASSESTPSSGKGVCKRSSVHSTSPCCSSSIALATSNSHSANGRRCVNGTTSAGTTCDSVGAASALWQLRSS